MSNLGTAGANIARDAIKSAGTHWALWVGDPGLAGAGGSEVSGGSYSRQSVTWGASANSAAVTFGPNAASWGTVTHWALMSASSSGNLIARGPLSTSRNMGTIGRTINYAIGAITIAGETS